MIDVHRDCGRGSGKWHCVVWMHIPESLSDIRHVSPCLAARQTDLSVSVKLSCRDLLGSARADKEAAASWMDGFETRRYKPLLCPEVDVPATCLHSPVRIPRTL
jgi:hypothetical protein